MSIDSPAAPQGATSGHDEATSLTRALTTRQITMIGLSGALGTGLFLGSGEMISVAGPSIILSYSLTGLLALVVVWAMAELTVQHPVAGGFGAAAHAYLGPFGGFLARWNVAIVMCIAVGAEVTAGAAYLRRWWPDLDPFVGTVLCSLLLVAINLATVRLYGSSEYWFSLLKVVVVIAFIALGLLLLLGGVPGRPAVGLGNLTAHDGFFPHGLSGMFAAAVLAMFSFGGVESVSVTAAESTDPTHDIPKAAHQMIVRLILFYVGAISIVVALAPWTQSATATGDPLLASPFVKVLAAIGIPLAADFMNVVLIVAALSAGNGCLYAASRMLHSLGTDGMAPRAFARTSADGAPRAAVVASTAGMVVAAVLALYRPADAFMTLIGVLIFGVWFTWTLTLLTYVAFRRLRGRFGLPSAPVQLWGGVATAVGGLVALALIGVALAFLPSMSIAWQVGGPYLVLLVLGFLMADAKNRGRAEDSVLIRELAERDRA